jgi:shikimate kinase
MTKIRLKGERIFLCGLSGSGKTTIGRSLAVKTGKKFIDIDAEIERETGLKIPGIFAEYGEGKFREYERKSVVKIVREEPAVIALGGGALENESSLMLVKKSGLLVYLMVSPQEAARRLAGYSDRPLLARATGTDDLLHVLASMLRKREIQYLTADVIIETDGKDPAEVTEEIVACLDVA